MSNIDKLILKMKRQPNGIRFQELAKVLESAFLQERILKMNIIEKYKKLPYNFIIQPINDESGYYYYARILEFDGCQSTGETFEEAYKNIQDAMEGWIEAKLEGGFEIPEPLNKEKLSGKFVIRIPKSLHYRLSVEAKKEEVSLNQYILYKLSR